jgi:hypothetical protein
MKTPDFKMLPQIFQNFPQILAVYLFGSSAAGKTHSESDLDLAVLPESAEFHRQKTVILTALARHGFCDVDLVFIDVDDIVLRYEAVRQNKLIYCRPDFDSASFFSKTIRQYLDFLPYLEVQRKAYKKRILDGQA